jgi:hypothetical protein
MLNLNPEQKLALKKLVEEDGYNLIDDMESAKNDLNVTAKSVEEIFGIKAVMFKKICKVHYETSLEKEKIKFNALDTLYTEIFGDTESLKEEE